MLEENSYKSIYICHERRQENDRTKEQCGERAFLFIMNVNNTTVPLTRAIQATNKVNYPQLRWKIRLPKYDSKSETTIDSCP